MRSIIRPSAGGPYSPVLSMDQVSTAVHCRKKCAMEANVDPSSRKEFGKCVRSQAFVVCVRDAEIKKKKSSYLGF